MVCEQNNNKTSLFLKKNVMKILIAGGSGLIGTALSKALVANGHQVVVLTRNPDGKKESAHISYAAWNPAQLEIDQQAVESADAIVNLAGANVAQRWTSAAKREIMDSRVNSTRTLVNALQNAPSKTLINASAIGIYPFGDEPSNEASPLGEGFLQDVVKAWEIEGQKAAEQHRVAFIRIGLVLSNDGGAMAKLLPVFKMGLGSAVGSGKQWQSWIHIDDLVNLFIRSIEDDAINGVINGVAPHPVTNQQFSKALAASLSKGFWAPKVPAFVLKLIFGEMSQVILRSQKVVSTVQDSFNFQCAYPNIDKALNELS